MRAGIHAQQPLLAGQQQPRRAARDDDVERCVSVAELRARADARERPTRCRHRRRLSTSGRCRLASPAARRREARARNRLRRPRPRRDSAPRAAGETAADGPGAPCMRVARGGGEGTARAVALHPAPSRARARPRRPTRPPARAAVGEPRRRLVQVCEHDRQLALPLERPLACHALVEDAAECVSGERPFERENELAVVFAHLNEPPPRVTDVRPELAAAWDGVVARALAKEPEERYATLRRSRRRSGRRACTAAPCRGRRSRRRIAAARGRARGRGRRSRHGAGLPRRLSGGEDRPAERPLVLRALDASTGRALASFRSGTSSATATHRPTSSSPAARRGCCCRASSGCCASTLARTS